MRRVALFSLLLLGLPGWAAAQEVRFNRDVRPILSEYCFHCHGPDEKGRKAKLRLDLREGGYLEPRGDVVPVKPGDPAASEVFRRVSSDDPDERMPPPEMKKHLTAAQVDTLKRWIEQGAAWQQHWAFEKPIDEKPPAVKQADRVKNAVDRFVLARLEKEGLGLSPEAERAKLIRRVTLDLTGLPPTLQEIEAFENDKSPDAYEKVVDRLLASPRYGQRMAWNWLDAARYADSNGYQGDNERTMWPWRDWVVDAINGNLPYDKFLTWQLAGDLLPDATFEQKLATAFNRNHMINGEGGRIAEENRVEYVLDQVETVGTVWLGLTYTCARCHDHKYDPISHRDYYAMFDFFNQTPVTGAGGNPKTPPVLAAPTEQQKKRIAAIEANVMAYRKQRDARARQVDAGLGAWERRMLASSHDAAWSPLPPDSASARYQKLKILKDDSVLAHGPNPDNDTYDVVYRLPRKRITGFRLEALKHKSMTGGALARSDSGNFVLTGFELGVRPKGGDQPKPLKIASALASYEQGPFKIEGAFDGKASTGWAVYEGRTVDREHEAVFRLAEPFEAREDLELVVTYRHESPHRSHNLGRFRLSATVEPEPKLAGAGGSLIALLRVPAEQRDDKQRAEVLRAYRESDAAYQKLAERLAAEQRKLNEAHKAVAQVMVMADRPDRRKTRILKTGLYNQPLEEVTADLPHLFGSLSPDAPRNRLSLAKWLLSEDNPLTARVVVNRQWQLFFGTGLVKTAEDFGSQGEDPSHPALLDWLAVRFRSDWDRKALHRLIVTSATYRQSAKAPAELHARDPENRLLARGPRYRLPSWMLRDQALALGGLLSARAGGPSVKPYQPAGVWAEATFGNKRYQPDTGESLYRRSLYVYWRRIVGPTMFFDVARRQTCEVKVARTNTPLHALVTLNDVTYVEAARAMAQQLLEDERDAATRLRRAFRLATARPPSAAEQSILKTRLDALRAWYARHPDEAAKVLAVGASKRNDKLDAVEHAAYTGMCSMILNLDEVLSK